MFNQIWGKFDKLVFVNKSVNICYFRRLSCTTLIKMINNKLLHHISQSKHFSQLDPKFFHHCIFFKKNQAQFVDKIM